MARLATTFSELVDWTATNDPHGTVLSWWRRVDRAVDKFYASKGEARPNRIRDVERDLARAPNIGQSGVELFQKLRKERNEVAHGDVPNLTREDAVRFAQEAFRIGWAILGLQLPELEVIEVHESAV